MPRAIWILAGHTVHSGLRRPAPWVLATLGVVGVWIGASLDILALGGGSASSDLAASAAEGIGVLVVVLFIVRVQSEDRSTAVSTVLDASAAGPVGRLIGRWAGATTIGVAAAAPSMAYALAFRNHINTDYSLYLPITIIVIAVEVALVGAWTLLASQVLPSSAAVIAGLAIAVLGRFSGHPALSSILASPGASVGESSTLLRLLAESLSTAAALSLALAASRLADSD